MGDLNPDLCNAGAVLYQLSYWVTWELVVMLIDDKPVDYRYRCIYVMKYMKFMYLMIYIYEV